MSYWRKLRDAVIAVVLLCIPFFFLRSNLKQPEEVGSFDRIVLQVSGPVQYAATQFADTVSFFFERYFLLVAVSEENERLFEQNKELSAKVDAYEQLVEENKRLHKLMQLRQQTKGEVVYAKVIGREVSDLFRVMRVRLDRGERDRIKPGMTVVSTKGLVGYIRRVWGRYSDILLTVDQTSGIDVEVGITKARGFLKGTGEMDQYVCRVEFLDRKAQIRIGDRVYTSGFGKRFPKGILIGEVTHVVKKQYGLYQEVTVKPSVEFSSLEEVMIIQSGPRQTVIKNDWPK